MKIHVFKLSFQSPLHLSRGKLNTYESSDDTLHSDTLKSAIFASALQLYGDSLLEEDFFEQFQVSSAFPFDGTTYYLPKPMSYFPACDNILRKRLKTARYIHTDCFERLLKGEKVKPGEVIKAGSPPVWQRDTTQRVMIDRITSRGVPFYLEKLYAVEPETRGLYFMVTAANNETALLSRLEKVIRFLGENGIGLQRNLGNGRFIVSRDVLEIALPEQASASIALSLYAPSTEEFNNSVAENGYYDFMQRGGWIASPADMEHLRLRKQSVYMMKEGSVFPFADNPSALVVRGQILDVTPDYQSLTHLVWRDGKGVFLPIKS